MDATARNQLFPQHLHQGNSSSKFMDNFDQEIVFVEDSKMDCSSEKVLKHGQKHLLGNLNSKLGLGKTSKRSTIAAGSATLPPLKVFKENTNVQYLPVITNKKTLIQQIPRRFKETQNEADKKAEDNSSMRVITGSIDYILKVHKLYPDLLVLYEVYGKVIKISHGKFSCQRVFLLRNEIGPVLQAIYYEIDSSTYSINIGSYVRCIGKFTGQRKLQIFKITPKAQQIRNESTIRLENICSFTLKKIKDP